MKNFLVVFGLLCLCHFNAKAQIDPPYPSVPSTALNIVEVEYFIDTDPGFGLGIKIPISAGVDLNAVIGSINVGALSVGAHVLGIRTRSAEGNWSITNLQQFVVDFDPPYPSAPVSVTNMIRGEYFIDTDPGFGNGQSFTLPAQTDISSFVAGLDLTAVAVGGHRLYFRTINASGRWSLTQSAAFVVDADPAYPSAPPAITNVVNAEYFFDTDPGIGNGTPISFAAGTDIVNINFAANKSSLGVGNHQLYIRTLGPTSLTTVTSFEVANSLPLRLLSFTTQVKDGKVWAEAVTTDEVNTDRIELQRSKDGTAFTSIASLPTRNTSGNQRYQFIDGHPLAGTSFYRLKMIDKDATFDFSRILSVDLKSNNKPAIYPNPVNDIIQLQIPIDGMTQVSVFSANGQTVLQQRVQVSGGKALIRIPSLTKGTYYLKVSMDQQSWTLPFLKQ